MSREVSDMETAKAIHHSDPWVLIPSEAAVFMYQTAPTTSNISRVSTASGSLI